MRTEKVLHTVKEKRNILRTTKRRKTNWIGHILLRNGLLNFIIKRKRKGGVEVMGGKKGRRRKRLLDELKERRTFWKLKRETLDLTVWRTCLGRRYEPVVRQTTE
jgi:hypothetical protein